MVLMTLILDMMACRFQTMVPMWDALNHITGHANVRLHHCSKKGALQMIATRRIAKGEQVCLIGLTTDLHLQYLFVQSPCGDLCVCPTSTHSSNWPQLYASLSASMCGISVKRDIKVLPVLQKHTDTIFAQVINSYGDLPNSELLRRYGFVETDPNPHDCVEIALADLHRSCLALRTPSSSNRQPSAPGLQPQSDTNSGGDSLLKESNTEMSDSGSGELGRHTERKTGQSRKRTSCSESCAGRKGASNGEERLAFLQEQSLVPLDGWFKVGRSGRAPPELLEAARLLLLPEHDFNTFVRMVRRWRAPLVRPLSRPTAADMPDGFKQVMKEFCKESIQRCEGLLAPSFLRCCMTSAKKARSGFSTDDMAAVVLRGESECARKFDAWLDLQSVDGLLRQCSSSWKHIRCAVRE